MKKVDFNTPTTLSLPKSRWLWIVAVVGVLLGTGLLYRLLMSVRPDRVLCPINPAVVEVPNCSLYNGQRYSRHRHHLLPAVELGRNELGLYRDFQGNLVVFTEVGLHPYPQAHSVVYPRNILLYKTERETDNPNKCSAFVRQHGLCDTPIDQVTFGKGIQGELDVAISFQMQATPDNLQALYDVGGLTSFVELFKQVVRGNRQLTNIGPELADTTEGAKQIEQSFRQAIAEWPLSYLVKIESLNVRSVVVGQEAYRQDLANQQAEVAKLTQDVKLLEQQKTNLATEQELERNRQTFEREQALQNAQNTAASIQAICQSVPASECSELVWIMTYGGRIRPLLGEDGAIRGAIIDNADPTAGDAAEPAPVPSMPVP